MFIHNYTGINIPVSCSIFMNGGVNRMKASARNKLKGNIKDLKKGPVSTEVVIDVKGMEVVSSITTGSAEDLKLRVGDEVTAIVKASNVMVGK